MNTRIAHVTTIPSASKLVAACLVLFTSCGGKSSTTDGDPLSTAGRPPSAGGAASISAGSSAGGTLGSAGQGVSRAGNPNAAGAASTSFAGNPSSGGTANNAGSAGTVSGAGGMEGVVGAGGIGTTAEAACTSVCSRFNSGCENLGSLGSTCQSDCSDTFAVQDGACTDLGVQMMSCLSETMPAAQLADCWIRFYDVSQQCYREVDTYKACVASEGGVLPPTLCAKISATWPADADSDTVSGCREDRKCLNGLNYAVDCHDTTYNRSLCSCKLRERPISDFVWPDSSVRACQDALPTCLALASTPAP